MSSAVVQQPAEIKKTPSERRKVEIPFNLTKDAAAALFNNDGLAYGAPKDVWIGEQSFNSPIHTIL